MAKYEEIGLLEFQERFSNEEKCREYLFNLRWSEGHVCERCGSIECKAVTKRRQYYCSKCGKQFSLTKGTIFEGTHLPIKTWFCAIFLIAKDKRGISTLQLQRELKVASDTATLLTRNIKNVMSKRDMEYLLDGIIEMDECFIGKPGGKAGRGTDKSKVLVALSTDEKGRPKFFKTTSCR